MQVDVANFRLDLPGKWNHFRAPSPGRKFRKALDVESALTSPCGKAAV